MLWFRMCSEQDAASQAGWVLEPWPRAAVENGCKAKPEAFGFRISPSVPKGPRARHFPYSQLSLLYRWGNWGGRRCSSLLVQCVGFQTVAPFTQQTSRLQSCIFSNNDYHRHFIFHREQWCFWHTISETHIWSWFFNNAWKVCRGPAWFFATTHP